MSSISKVVVVQRDRRSADAVRLGFEREGASVVAAREPEEAAGLIGPDTGLVVAGHAGDADAARALLAAVAGASGGAAPILWVGNGVRREEAWAAGADEVLPQPAFLRDVVTIGKLLGGRPRGQRAAISGDLGDHVGVFYLVRALSAIGRSGVLTLSRGLRRGEIRFFEGEITSAHMGALHGQAGLHQLLLWSDARFEWRHEPVVRRRQIPLPEAEVLAQAARFLEDMREAAGGLSPSAVFEQDVQRIQAMAKQLPTEVHGVLRLFDGNRTIADVLEDSPFRVLETLRVAQRAVEVGLLRRVQSTRPKVVLRAVLAVDEWLVGSEPKEAVIDRTMAIGQSEPVPKQPAPRAETGGGKRHKGQKGKKGKKGTRDRESGASRALATGAEIDWAALVPRATGVDTSAITGVVPASSLSGEIVIGELEGGAIAARREGREGLEALTDAEARKQMFPVEVNLGEAEATAAETGTAAGAGEATETETETAAGAETETAAGAEAEAETETETAAAPGGDAAPAAAGSMEEALAAAAAAAPTAPVDAAGELRARAPEKPPEAPAEPAGGPSILVQDLAAAHAAISSVATREAAAPPTADAHDPATSAEIAAVRGDAAAFSEDEEAFFRAAEELENAPARAAPVESFADLDEGYQPQTFWERLLGKRDKSRPK